MYVLLTKRDDRKHDWEQDLFRFCARVGLKRTRGPADAMDQLQPGIDELKKPTKEGKLFLQDGGLVDVRGERAKIRFVFARADPTRAQTISEDMHKYLRARLRTDLYENFFSAIRFSLDNRRRARPRPRGSGPVQAGLPLRQLQGVPRRRGGDSPRATHDAGVHRRGRRLSAKASRERMIVSRRRDTTPLT
jgi:hypothetical protein